MPKVSSDYKTMDGVVSFKCFRDEHHRFLGKYPKGVLQIFLRKCMKKAITDRDFFETIFFGVKDD